MIPFRYERAGDAPAAVELSDAQPLPGNAFKVPLARNTIVRTLLDLLEIGGEARP
jgi:xanthine dehydrogenase YagS FAD-binding subunit